MSQQSEQSAAVVRDEAARMGVSPQMANTLIHIMMIESGGNPNSSAGTSSAKGLFQILNGEWNDLLRRFPDIANGAAPNVMDPAQNTRAAIHMLIEKEQQLRHNIGREPTPGEFYLSHFAGLTGATRIINADPSTPMTQLMSSAAVNANRNVRYRRPDGTTVYLPNMTAADMRAWAEQKMGGTVPAGSVAPPGPGTPGVDPNADTTTDTTDGPDTDARRPTGLFEMIMQLILALFTSLFDTDAPRSTEPAPPAAPGQPAPAPRPRDPSTYLQPELAYDLAVLNTLGLPDTERSRAQMLRIFDADGNGRISEQEVLRFDLNHDGVLGIADLASMRQQLLAVGRAVSNNASAADVVGAYSELLRNPPQVTMPTVDTALGLDEHGLAVVHALASQGVQVDIAGQNGAHTPDGKFDANDIAVMNQRLRDAGVVVQPGDNNALLTTYAQNFGRQQAPSVAPR